ncbi:CDP-glycerol glycerophosphotransferase family protein, partial [Vagococcus salmoninarum]
MGIKNIISRVIGPVYKPFRHQPAKQGLMFARYSEKLSIEKATIMYESRDGQSLTDSPLAIFKYLLENDQEKKYTHIWSYVDSVELKQIIKLYQAESNVIFVQRNSQNYLKWLAKAEYVINNATLQPFY